MRTFFKWMKSKKSGISEENLLVFEDIINTYFVPGRGSSEGDSKFMQAIGEQFTEEQRFRIWEQNGGCRGSAKHEKSLKEFSIEHADKPLSAKSDLYIEKEFSEKTRNVVLDEKNKTIAVTFACDECYKRSIKGITTAPVTLYYESCAGGRLQNLQTALGMKLKIKSVDTPAQGVSKENPCIYTFDIVE